MAVYVLASNEIAIHVFVCYVDFSFPFCNLESINQPVSEKMFELIQQRHTSSLSSIVKGLGHIEVGKCHVLNVRLDRLG